MPQSRQIWGSRVFDEGVLPHRADRFSPRGKVLTGAPLRYIVPAVSKNVPHLTLPTSDYEQMRGMSNRRLVSLLRSAVLAEDRAGRFSPRPPEQHDAYTVEHRTNCIELYLMRGGEAVFCCRFVAAE